ncbi:DUF1176 domain-containing protein [uncultured Shewanella sp.]|uniref:DUF1176 domain-containing protein n=1 Tax=uncultured Shewanella sp. TaxID=173975 RepID=UPI002603B860|nr:DUF1176 domain-containing protein [uncultured Shewanella sp.]
MQGFKGLVGFCSLFISLFISLSVTAGQGLSFFHGDWQVVCDSTNTCRAVGYHNSEQQNKLGEYAPVSVIFERAAGANAQIKGKVKFGASSYKVDSNQTPNEAIALTINDSYQSQLGAKMPAYEELGMSFSDERELTKEQVSHLLNALTMKGNVAIKFNSSAGEEWRLSTTGSTAVLLKMDDFQGLVNTPFAIVKKGPRTTNIVQPKQAPVISIPEPLPVTTDADSALAKNSDFISRIQTAVNQSCDIAPAEDGKLDLNVARLSEHLLVVTAPCWSAAYNYGDGVWIVDDNPNIEPKFITDSATNYANGIIDEFMKGRGIADCVSARRLIWNGSDFILADDYSTGDCREIAMGGAWYLPTKVSTVILGNDPAAGIDCQSEQAYNTEGMVKCTQRSLASVELKIALLIDTIHQYLNATNNADLSRAIKTAQESWLSYRNDVCRVVRLTHADGSMSLPLMVGCKLELTEKRLKQLQMTKKSLI